MVALAKSVLSSFNVQLLIKIIVSYVPCIRYVSTSTLNPCLIYPSSGIRIILFFSIKTIPISPFLSELSENAVLVWTEGLNGEIMMQFQVYPGVSTYLFNAPHLLRPPSSPYLPSLRPDELWLHWISEPVFPRCCSLNASYALLISIIQPVSICSWVTLLARCESNLHLHSLSGLVWGILGRLQFYVPAMSFLLDKRVR